MYLVQYDKSFYGQNLSYSKVMTEESTKWQTETIGNWITAIWKVKPKGTFQNLGINPIVQDLLNDITRTG